MTFACALALAPTAALAADPAKTQGTLVDLAAEASRSAPNDLARATAFFEANDANPGELAKRVNSAIAAALQAARGYATVKTRSGNTWTNPNYGKDGRITGWRMRSELLIESRDIAALSELIGKLQATLGVGQITLQPTPETRRKAEDDATLDAIAAFQAKAKLVADALNKPYRIRQISIGAAGRPPVFPIARTMAVQAEAAPAPIEAGESMVTVSVSGQIELPE
jgi:predicted secreted protein